MLERPGKGMERGITLGVERGEKGRVGKEDKS
jgi:hypothetical protein